MAGTLRAGPFSHLSLAGAEVPLYMIPFDKKGVLQAPGTAEHLVRAVAAGVDDVIVVMHGWNTDFRGAVGLCRDLVGRLDDVARTRGAPRPGTRTIVVGISWPSILMPGTATPAMAGGDDAGLDGLDGLDGLAELGELMPAEQRGEFYRLMESDGLGPEQAERLAELLAPLYSAEDGDVTGIGGSDPAATVAAWRASEARLAEAEGPLVVSGPTGPAETPAAGAVAGPAAGPGAGPAAGPAAGPQAAGLFDVLDPRNIARTATVLLMKDRAGVVGLRGAGPLIARILGARDGVRVHVAGHSYGCKASLSAVSADLPRPVRSLLLLQPALSYLALADDVPQLGRPGGYARAKSRVELPVLATWSTHDVALRTLFALAVRRKEDLGEQNIGAAGRENPPSRFAAMGGYGPQPGSDVLDVDILRPDSGQHYPLSNGKRVLAVNGSSAISGHSDVKNAATAWALYNLLAA